MPGPRTRQPRSPKPKPFTLAELRDPVVRLPAELGDGLVVNAELHHWVRYGTTTPLNATWLTEPPPEHRLTLRLYRDELTRGMGRTQLGHPASLARWQTLIAIDGLKPLRDRERGVPYVTIGALRIRELPDNVRRQAGESWFTWMDGEGTNLGEIADRIAKDETMALLGGGLFWFESLDVHPRLRGQHLGARLLAHALWLLVDDECDVAILEARSVGATGDKTCPPRTPEGTRALVRYYERVGFQCWTTGRRPVDFNDAVAMWHQGGMLTPGWGVEMEREVYGDPTIGTASE